MLELKITVETAKDLNQEIKDLYKAIVGSSIDKADAIDQAKEEVKAKKAKTAISTSAVIIDITFFLRVSFTFSLFQNVFAKKITTTTTTPTVPPITKSLI